MKKLGVLLLMATFILTGVSTIMAQDTETDSHNLKIKIPSIAILDIESSAGGVTDIEMGPELIDEAGESLDLGDITNNVLWLNWSSVKPADGLTRNIAVTMDKDAPASTSLELNPSTTPTGVGALGTVTSNLSLDAAGGDLVTGIGSCYTTDGPTKGINLVYTLSILNSDYENLVAEETDIVVTFTMSDS